MNTRRTTATPKGKVRQVRTAPQIGLVSRPQVQLRTIRAFDPDALLPTFDFIYELESNLDAYEVSNGEGGWLSIPRFPGYVSTSLECCRANCTTVKTPSQAAAIACAIDHGIKRFYNDAEIDGLIQLRKNLHQIGGKIADSGLLEMASEFFRRFPLGLPGTMLQSRRVNSPLPHRIKTQVAERASELGLGIAPMSVLAIMVTISEQTVVHPDHAALASETVNKFFQQVRIRRRVAEVFMEEAE